MYVENRYINACISECECALKFSYCQVLAARKSQFYYWPIYTKQWMEYATVFSREETPAT